MWKIYYLSGGLGWLVTKSLLKLRFCDSVFCGQCSSTALRPRRVLLWPRALEGPAFHIYSQNRFIKNHTGTSYTQDTAWPGTSASTPMTNARQALAKCFSTSLTLCPWSKKLPNPNAGKRCGRQTVFGKERRKNLRAKVLTKRWINSPNPSSLVTGM